MTYKSTGRVPYLGQKVAFKGGRIMTYFKKRLVTVLCYTGIVLAMIMVGIFLIIDIRANIENEKKEMNEIEKNSKLHTSKVVAYQFKPQAVNIIKLEDGTQFEQETMTMTKESNFKSKVKFDRETVEKLPKVTYAKKKQDSEKMYKEMYYIFKVE